MLTDDERFKGMTHGTNHHRPFGGAAALALGLALWPQAARAAAEPTQQPPASQTAAAPQDDYERGLLLLAKGDSKGAAAALKRAAERRKTDADAWYQLGLAHSHARKPKDARKAFERALKLRPDWADARTGIAFSLLTLDKTRDAEREARRALASEPQNAGAHYVIGAIRFREEKFAEALSAAEAALRAKPDFPAAAFLAGDAMLNTYIDKSVRLGQEHPLPFGASDEERKAVSAKREPVLAPFKARMRELADRLDAFAAAQPNNPDAEGWREQAGTLRLYGKPTDAGGSFGVFTSSQLTKKAIITFKPEPGYSEEARKQNVTGVVRLRAVLAPDGRVRHIVAIRRLPAGLTEKAIAAARQIRFEPASINGTPVAQYVVLEYNFNIY